MRGARYISYMSNLLHSCAFCGSDKNVTKDHVPPKNVFPEPRPSDLITVPACDNCNKATSMDDEYFRLMLCMSDQVGHNPDARKNRETILRSLDRNEAPGLRTSFLTGTRMVQVRTPAGLHLARRLAFDVDLQRIFRIVEKTVKGLLFQEFGRRFSSDYGVAVHSNDSLSDWPADDIEELRWTILMPLAQTPPKIIGDGVFSYRCQASEKDPFLTVWALTFYGAVSFVCLTGPANGEGGG